MGFNWLQVEEPIVEETPEEAPADEPPVEEDAPPAEEMVDVPVTEDEPAPAEEPVEEEPAPEEPPVEEALAEEPVPEEAAPEEPVIEEMVDVPVTEDEPVPEEPQVEAASEPEPAVIQIVRCTTNFTLQEATPAATPLEKQEFELQAAPEGKPRTPHEMDNPAPEDEEAPPAEEAPTPVASTPATPASGMFKDYSRASIHFFSCQIIRATNPKIW